MMDIFGKNYHLGICFSHLLWPNDKGENRNFGHER
jgi:hypothetical protein